MKISTFYTEKTRNRPQSSQIFNLNNEEREGRFEAKIKELEGLVAELAPLNPENQALRARVQTLLEGAAKSGKTLDELRGTVSTLTVDLQDKQRILGTFDQYQSENKRLVEENDMAIKSLATTRFDKDLKEQELARIQERLSLLEIEHRSTYESGVKKDDLLKEATSKLDVLTQQHKELSEVATNLANKYSESSDQQVKVVKMNESLAQELVGLKQAQENTDMQERKERSQLHMKVEQIVSRKYEAKLKELQQDVDDLVQINFRLKQALNKPNRSSIGAIAKQEAVKMPLASSAINFRKNNLGTGTVTLPRFGQKQKEIS